MTRDRRKTHDGYYVTAIIDGGTANQRTSWLVGPFTGPRGHMAALAMVEPARRATHHSDDPLNDQSPIFCVIAASHIIASRKVVRRMRFGAAITFLVGSPLTKP